MAIFDPSKYEDEAPQQDFFAPAGDYELYFSEIGVKVNQWESGPEKVLSGKVTFMDGPRAGKYFFHEFKIFQGETKEKLDNHRKYFATFCKAIKVGPFDPEENSDILLNKTFIGTVQVNDKNGKKTNRLIPWVFHAVGEPVVKPKTSTKPSGSSAGSSAQSGIREHESDIPF